MTFGNVTDGRTLTPRLWWEPGEPGCLPRTAPVTRVVLHWTGGEGGHAQIHRTLRSRGLAVHFTCAQDGTIVQHANVTSVCAHAGKIENGRSVGIEIASTGLAPAHEKWPRRLIPARIHGRSVRTLGFYEAQTAAVLALTRQLCTAFNIPYAVPRTADGAVIGDALKPAERAAWRGVLGHLHISDQKTDPGLALLDAVR